MLRGWNFYILNFQIVCDSLQYNAKSHMLAAKHLLRVITDCFLNKQIFFSLNKHFVWFILLKISLHLLLSLLILLSNWIVLLIERSFILITFLSCQEFLFSPVDSVTTADHYFLSSVCYFNNIILILGRFIKYESAWLKLLFMIRQHSVS